MEAAVEALASVGTGLRSIALTGRPYPGNDLPEVAVVEGIDYADSSAQTQPRLLADRLEEVAAEALDGTPDVWHVHNHSLGKNPAFTAAVNLLAERGHGMLLQIHDFAEDGRPDNYLALRNNLSNLSLAYPITPKIHYAALNQRDAGFLMRAGLPEAQLHLLPNPARTAPEPTNATHTSADLPPNLVLCPVRAVRRKNLGELALLAAAHPQLLLANTLGPTNPSYAPAFQRWKDFSASLQLPVRYAFAEESGHSFAALVEAAHSLVTTSVAEGFGMAFLEPWVQGKTLAGRDLPEITADFRQAGLCLDHLYERLDLPLELIDPEALVSRIRSTLETIYDAYDEALPEDGVSHVLSAMTKDNRIDFGRLDETLQEDLVQKIASSPALAEEVRNQAKLEPLEPDLVKANATIVAQRYGMGAYGQKLSAAYREIAGADSGSIDHLDANHLLKDFLKLERLFLLRG